MPTDQTARHSHDHDDGQPHDHSACRGHDHGRHQLDASIAGRLRWAILLTAVTLAAEVVGGIWTHSLALLSDAAHVFLDLFALVLSLAAINLAARPASAEHSFGLHRAEVFASFVNGVSVFVIAVGIFYEAWQRLGAPETIKGIPLLVIAGVGLAMNLLAASALHSHSHDDLNVKGAFLHVVGDAAASVGVMAGAVVIHFTGWYVVDTAISALIGLVIISGAWRLIRDSVHILMEGVPRGLSLEQVAAAMRGVAGVRDVHHLNIWTICSHIRALSAHLDIVEDQRHRRGQVLQAVEELLKERFHITHTTLQAECLNCGGLDLIKQFRHAPRSHHHHTH